MKEREDKNGTESDKVRCNVIFHPNTLELFSYFLSLILCCLGISKWGKLVLLLGVLEGVTVA